MQVLAVDQAQTARVVAPAEQLSPTATDMTPAGLKDAGRQVPGCDDFVLLLFRRRTPDG